MAQDLRAKIEEGLAHQRAGRLDEAEAIYRAVLAENRDEPNAANLLGTIALAKGHHDAAVRLAAHAFKLRPDSALFAGNLGAALAAAGHPDKAAQMLAGAVRGRPDDPLIRRNLGTALSRLGRTEEALEHLDRAATLAPDLAENHLGRAYVLKDLGRRSEALAAVERTLAAPSAAPATRAQAEFLRAALSPEQGAPARAPASYVKELFDVTAARFDAELESLGYQTPDLMAAMLAETLGAPAGRLSVLDLGCGTGLSGLALRAFAANLVGLDLSPRMLAAAKARGCYDMLLEGDLLDLLPTMPAESFDLVAAADVLNYLGDLYPALAAIARRLKPGGSLIFSTEATEGAGAGPAGYALGEGLRFRHDPAHVAELAADAGFELKARKRVVLRREGSVAVEGDLHLFTLL
ncbi:MAG: methyltransferase domain-containing protein [Alphaproteobacteria bacterium]|nr:methyltransferase domain-containing protein [Alphaproteobacteria bacterium]